MRKAIISVMAIVACLLCNAGGAQAAGGIHWGNSLHTAIVQAKKTGRLVMVDFYADWCGFCKKLDAETYTDPAVIQTAQQIIPVKLNPERNSEGMALARRLNVHGLPAIIFINGNGEVEGKIGGFEPAPAFLQSLQGILQQHRDLPVMQTRLHANPNDLPAAAQLTAIYAGQGRLKQAGATLAKVAQLDPNSAKGYLTRSQLAVAHLCMTAQDVNQAITLLEQAARSAHNSEDRAVAHINLAICYSSMHKLDIAESELNTTLALPNCPAGARQMAQQMLARVQQLEYQEQ